MKKLLTFVLVIAMLLSLTGCMAAIHEVNICKDGSGDANVLVGYTAEGWELMASNEGEETPDLSEMHKFTYNGVDYYGTSETYEFKTVAELNEKMSSTQEDGSVSRTVLIERLENGDFTVNVSVTPAAEEAETEQMDTETKAVYDKLMAAMAVVYRYSFPYNVVQTAGPADGVVIEGKRLIVDYMAAQKAATEETHYRFLASPANKLTFTDVAEEAWYYNAVTALAEGGLVAGMGNNLFAPDNTLTRAQFCQILARAKKLPTGSAHNYWAYNAIDSCLTAGYITEDGAITPEAFDAPITREAAVAAMYLAKKDEVESAGEITAEMIPDFGEISEAYRDNILAAYNCGITTGMDASRTFAPKSTLTRAQVCQLFYNLSWTN